MIGDQLARAYELRANEAGEFTMGGPRTFCGLIGHKVIVDTYGGAAETVDRTSIVTAVRDIFDLRPGIIIRDLDPLRPIYRHNSVYGHFGRSPHDIFTWETTNRVDDMFCV